MQHECCATARGAASPPAILKAVAAHQHALMPSYVSI